MVAGRAGHLTPNIATTMPDMTYSEQAARAVATMGQPPKVFDWNRAAAILRERGVQEAEAGLAEDWGWTGGAILTGGQPVTHDEEAGTGYTYLTSTWATPTLRIFSGTDFVEDIPCFLMPPRIPDGWGADTQWPPSARAIFGSRTATLTIIDEPHTPAPVPPLPPRGRRRILLQP